MDERHLAKGALPDNLDRLEVALQRFGGRRSRRVWPPRGHAAAREADRVCAVKRRPLRLG